MIFYNKQKEILKLQKLINLHTADSIADIGAGIGFYSLGFSKIVENSGMVFATEFKSQLLLTLGNKIKSNRITNITLLQSSNDNCNLQENSVDYIFLRGVYHHLSNPIKFNSSLYKALKQTGKLVIIDFPPKFFLSLFSPVKNVPANRKGHGISQEILVNEMSDAGFKLEQAIPNWVWGRYCLVFKK